MGYYDSLDLIFRSSPLIRGDPQRELAFDISRIRRTIFGSTGGRPGFPFSWIVEIEIQIKQN